jgi:hypothetical protein
MAHWRSVAGAADPDAARLYEIRYEALVADPEPEIRKLLGFCGLPFDAACLEFHRNRRRVRTASGAQVRQPLYRAAVGSARAYEKELAPFRRVLESRWRWRMPRLAAWVP